MPEDNDPGRESPSPNFELDNFRVMEDETESSEGEEGNGLSGEDVPAGYQPLPQDVPSGQPLYEESDEDDDNNDADIAAYLTSGQPHNPEVQEMVEASRRAQRTDEDQERDQIFTLQPRAQDIPMDPAKVESIKLAMARMKLPTPTWAQGLSEDDWQAMVESKLMKPK